ncbi:MAG: helix-turn-helix transcriptional regulator [Gemmatimonadetes bacterium]|nr:helix-turn-helix transcriptional regulator [Gemmatimonadota bacterium]
MNDAEIGARVRAAREAQGLTRPAMTSLVAASESQIRKLEDGDRRWTLDWLSRFSRALGVPVAELVGPEPLPEEHGAGPLASGASGEEDHTPADLLSGALIDERGGNRRGAVRRVRAYLGLIGEDERPPRARRRPS